MCVCVCACVCAHAFQVVPESPVVLTVGLHVSQVEAQALGDVQHVAEVQADGVEEHGGHGDLIQRPHILTPPRVVGLPPAELHPELTRPWGQLHGHYPEGLRGEGDVLSGCLRERWLVCVCMCVCVHMSVSVCVCMCACERVCEGV